MPTFRQVDSASVNVSVKIYAISFVSDNQRIMRQKKLLLVKFQNQTNIVEQILFTPVLQCCVMLFKIFEHCARIVISLDENDLTVKSLQQLVNFLVFFGFSVNPSNVAQVINRILVANDFIPCVHDLLVHFFNA